MIQTIERSAADGARLDVRSPRLWGLGASSLHDAYWRARGVQCVRRGDPQPLQKGAELFLLVEPYQLVLFDVGALADRLAWRGASVTRIRVVATGDEAYGERVEVDDDGMVRRVARRYEPRSSAAYRVMLTQRRRLARAWMAASERRSGWRKIRELSGWSRIDNCRIPGRCARGGRWDEEGALIGHLVERWSGPGCAIDGIREIQPGIWVPEDETFHAGVVAIGPAWLGRGAGGDRFPCLIGPIWIEDAGDETGPAPRGARLRDIRDIEVDEGEKRTARRRSPRRGYAVAKRLLDIGVSGIGLVLGLPLFVLVALCIVIEDGPPVFFGQVRQSRYGRAFRCWKFRTMCHNADEIKAELASRNVCDGPQFHIADDPRVTRVGRVLRRSHLDELPQLWNVLLGQMSLVGPRPSPEVENRICPTWREMRLSVRPGITGLWQLMRTREPGVDFQEWIRYDIEYVDRASFWLDVKILTRTIANLVRAPVGR